MSTIKYTAQWIGGPNDGHHETVQRTDTHHTITLETNDKTKTITLTIPITKNKWGERTLIWTPQHQKQT